MFEEQILSSEKSKQTAAKWMWIFGFFFMPWAWGMCALCFRKYWFSVKYPKMRFYVRFSFWGFLIESIIVLAWFITYLCVYPHAGNGFQSFSVIHTKISLFE